MPDSPGLAIVTGAAGGIGAAVTRRLVGDGFTVLAADRVEVHASAYPEGRVTAFKCDVSSAADIKELVAAAGAADRPLAAVVHAAGIVGEGPLTEVSLEDWQRVIDVNLTSAFLLLKATHPLLAASKGCAVLFASTNALNGGSAASGPAYSAAKAGLVNLTRYLALEWAAEQIRVNCVAPGPIDTPMLDRLSDERRAALVAAIPAGRLGNANDVAAAVAYLCSGDACYLTGTVQNVSGGLVLD